MVQVGRRRRERKKMEWMLILLSEAWPLKEEQLWRN